MRVQRVLEPPTDRESWTVLSHDGVVAPVDRFLTHLTAIERSPNTVRAYAHDLRDFFVYLAGIGLEWDRPRLEDLGGFVAWLRLPPEARSGAVRVLPSVGSFCSAGTINRKLAAVASFYEFHARHGVDVGPAISSWRRSGRGGSWQPFLAHLGERPRRERDLSLRVPRVAPGTLSSEQVAALLAACEHLRDRFLLALLHGSGLRIGEALGLRHEDLNARRRELTVRPRVNSNGARAKSATRTIPLSSRLFVLYSDYLHEEYGALDCDFVFVNLWGDPRGAPMTYSSVNGLIRRLRTRTGIGFTPHVFRHTFATELLRRGVAAEVVRVLLGHASGSTTIDTYSHLGVEDLRAQLEATGAAAITEEIL